MISQPRLSAASITARRSKPILAFIVQVDGTPNSSKMSNMRQTPTRWPYSPRPVRVVIDISRQIAADDTGTPGIERLRRILSHVPGFEIGRDHDSESLPVRPPKRLSLGNRHKLVFHGSHSRPVKHPDETTRFRGLLSNIDPNLRTSFKTPQAGAQALEFCP